MKNLCEFSTNLGYKIYGNLLYLMVPFLKFLLNYKIIKNKIVNTQYFFLTKKDLQIQLFRQIKTLTISYFWEIYIWWRFWQCEWKRSMDLIYTFIDFFKKLKYNNNEFFVKYNIT